MAWVERLPSGKFRGGWRDSTGRKRYTDPHALKRDAREEAQEQEVKARRQAAKSAGKLSARISWGEWWDTLSETRVFESDNDRTEYYIVKDYLLPQWGDIPLNRIEQPDVQRWVNALVAGNVPGWKHDRLPEPSYAQRIYQVFSASISRALADGVLTTSPCVGVKLPKRRRKPKAYMPVGDAAKLELRPDYRDAVDFGLETGLRPGEICGLHESRIDFDTGWLYVVEAFVERKRVIRPCPKDKDARKVPLTGKAMDIVRRRLDREGPAGCGLPHTDSSKCQSPLVFLTERGKVMRPKGLYDAMTLAAGNAKLPARGGYTLRRGWGTRLAESLSPFEIARYFGHETLEQANEYVQETPAARARLLVALGEQTPLQAVRGAHGAANGADADLQGLHDTTSDTDESTG